MSVYSSNSIRKLCIYICLAFYIYNLMKKTLDARSIGNSIIYRFMLPTRQGQKHDHLTPIHT